MLVRAVIVGAGHRGLGAASYALSNPEQMQIVGVVDPADIRRNNAAAIHQLPAEHCFESVEQFLAYPKFADVVINATMDALHVPTSLPLLEAGYDILLEKPIATSKDDLLRLYEAAKRLQRTVMICHVLRYAPFYTAIRKRVADGVIGDVMSVQTVEHVSYHHMAVGFVRGKWRSKQQCGSSMLMAKCCHDLDLISWMKSGVAPVSVASHGSRMFFCRERMPERAGTRCMVDCPIEEQCLYSARKHYIDHPERWSFYVWDSIEHIPDPTIEDKVESLKTDNPFGVCVWRCDNDVVDHQTVSVEFADGSTALHSMVGGTARPVRSIHLVGTEGEIQGVLEDNTFVIRHIDTSPGHEYSEEIVDLKVTDDMHGESGGHGGGDIRLVADFVRVIQGEPRSIAATTIEDSINGHLIGFCADVAREERRVVEVPLIG
jgi:predicted dehydrogenase